MVMEALKSSQEIVHEGFLIKSPPTKRWRAVSRWRKRWFALRHSGELPGQYFLEYYVEKGCKKLKGRIDLDQCEQVDAGLRFENRKQKYQYMFNVKTPKRIYYLVAESETDMNKWVDAVCQVCGLKAYTQDEEQQLFNYETQESPPISPTSTISGPYIPISECISGRRYNIDTSSLNSGIINPELYDAPRKLAPAPPPTTTTTTTTNTATTTTTTSSLLLQQSSSSSPPRSPTTTDAESVFTDDEWTTPVPSVNWETFPSSCDSKISQICNDNDIGSWRVRQRFGKLRIVDSTTLPNDDNNTILPAPPRPPKPSHMINDNNNPGHNYLNLDSSIESSKPTTPATPAPSTPSTAIITDETYDFPRSHQPNCDNNNEQQQQQHQQQQQQVSTIGRSPSKHCYSNAAPSTIDDRIFRYDFPDDEPSSPRSESSTTATYSNLPSPLIRDSYSGLNSTNIIASSPSSSSTTAIITASSSISTTTPPVVYRELKPGRKTSDSLSIISNEPSPGPVLSIPDMSSAEHSPAEPPSINRKLKPAFIRTPTEVSGPLKLASPPGRGRLRAAPSPTPPINHVHGNRHHSISDEDINTQIDDKEEVYYYQDQNTFIPASRAGMLQYLDLDLDVSDNFATTTLPPAQSPPNTTVYKTVDFLKTEAFNRTRQRVEEERKRTDVD